MARKGDSAGYQDLYDHFEREISRFRGPIRHKAPDRVQFSQRILGLLMGIIGQYRWDSGQGNRVEDGRRSIGGHWAKTPPWLAPRVETGERRTRALARSLLFVCPTDGMIDLLTRLEATSGVTLFPGHLVLANVTFLLGSDWKGDPQPTSAVTVPQLVYLRFASPYERVVAAYRGGAVPTVSSVRPMIERIRDAFGSGSRGNMARDVWAGFVGWQPRSGKLGDASWAACLHRVVAPYQRLIFLGMERQFFESLRNDLSLEHPKLSILETKAKLMLDMLDDENLTISDEYEDNESASMAHFRKFAPRRMIERFAFAPESHDPMRFLEKRDQRVGISRPSYGDWVQILGELLPSSPSKWTETRLPWDPYVSSKIDPIDFLIKSSWRSPYPSEDCLGNKPSEWLVECRGQAMTNCSKTEDPLKGESS